ncbi:hypothetical protein AC1031_018842 [Aphanomyces cochlioides]|nr:hypothetical protein AC1031_018842 [Aphanomyces cochlioides]
MIQNGIHNRNPKDVLAKISSIESSYREAREWREHTGQGIEDEDSIKNELKRRCPYFFELDEVMRDRASTQPLVTSEQLDNQCNGEILSDSEDECDAKNTPSKKTKQLDASTISTSNSQRKRTAMQAKIDDWTEITRQSYSLRQDEIKQKEEEIRMKRDIDEKRLQLEMQREQRLAEESKLNKEILELKAAETMRDFEYKKEIQGMEKRMKIVETRRRLKSDGWSEEEIDYVCPL